MVKIIKTLCMKYKELILYGIFGVGATAINIVAFYVLDTLIGCQLVFANVLAWVFAYVFAFVTNKSFVFESKVWKSLQAIKEFIDFFIARIVTLFIDTILMWLFVEIMFMNSLVAKVIVNVIVIVLNYVASKMWIFKK